MIMSGGTRSWLAWIRAHVIKNTTTRIPERGRLKGSWLSSDVVAYTFVEMDKSWTASTGGNQSTERLRSSSRVVSQKAKQEKWVWINKNHLPRKKFLVLKKGVRKNFADHTPGWSVTIRQVDCAQRYLCHVLSFWSECKHRIVSHPN